MAAILWSQVAAFEPSLATAPPEVQAVILARVETLSATFFGGPSHPVYELARILAAAHLAMTVGPTGAGAGSGGGVSGPVTSRSEGGVSESYAVSASIGSGFAGVSWGATRHGLAFVDLVRSRPGRLGLIS